MLPLEQENVSFLEKMSVDDLAKWLLTDRSLTPVWYKDDDSDITRLVHTYKLAGESTKEKISKALISAVSAWDSAKDGPESLVDLAFLGALTRNEEVVPYFIKIIDDKKIRPSEDEDEEDNFASVISCLIGSTIPEAKEAVGRWYKDEKFDYHCSAHLCVGLVSYYPERFREFLPKLLKDMDKNPDYFLPGYVASTICEYTGPDELEKALTEFDNKSAKALLAEMPVAREIYAEVRNDSHGAFGEEKSGPQK